MILRFFLDGDEISERIDVKKGGAGNPSPLTGEGEDEGGGESS